MSDVDKQRIAARDAIYNAFHIPPELLVERRPRSSAEEVLDAVRKAEARQQDADIRRMLGQWVSELEPSLVMWNGRIHGLAWAGDPQGRIVVYNGLDPRPLLKIVATLAGVAEVPDIA